MVNLIQKLSLKYYKWMGKVQTLVFLLIYTNKYKYIYTYYSCIHVLHNTCHKIFNFFLQLYNTDIPALFKIKRMGFFLLYITTYIKHEILQAINLKQIKI